MKKKRDQLKKKLDDIEKAGESKWKKNKKRLAESIDQLNKKIQKSLEQ
jgi:hypothetical protein